jgi:beta-glucosidase
MRLQLASRGHARLLIACLGALIAATLAGAATPARSSATATSKWNSGTLTDVELHSLVSQMTVPEEVGMVHGYGDPPAATSPVPSVNGEAGGIAGVPRLGIPPLRFTDGPAGIRLAHVETAMPAPVGLTATWDRAAARLYGETVGDAGRATGEDVWLAPMVNQVNFVTGGRDFETLGEDPFLAGELVAPEVQGVQSKGMVAEVKHFAENDFENGRTSTSVTIGDQTLHETELQAFQSAIDAGAGAVMCAYNRINDVYSCSNDHTLNGILRGQWGFGGFVTSDWGAVHRVSDLIHGNDIEQPGNANGTSTYGQQLLDAVANGTAAIPLTNDFPAEPAHSAAEWKAALDTAVFRILKEENNIGLLEGTQYGTHFTDGTPYVPPRPDLESLKPSSFSTAQSIAEESATLLKNDDRTLPLTHGDATAGLAVIGPTAVAPYVGGGGSAHVTPYDPVESPYAALVAAGAHVKYAQGYDLDGHVVPSSALTAPDPANPDPNWTLTPADAAFAGQHGLLRQQITTAAVPSGSQPALQPGGAPDQLDSTVDHTGSNSLPAGTGWRWTGTLTAPTAGPWQLKVFVAHQANAQLFVDGLANAQRRINIGAYPAAPTSSYAGLNESARSHDLAAPDLQQATFTVTYAAGEQHHLDLRLVTGATPAEIQFRWVPPDNQTQAIADAVAAASSAQKAIVFAYDDGSEGRDRGTSDQAAGLALPGYQDALISAVAAANPNTIVVLNTGDPVLMPWVDQVRAVLEMWYPGELGGPATADVLLGNANPSGKLPESFPASATAFPTYDPGCTDTSITGNCPLYPGVAMPGFVSGNHSYRTITAMDVNGIFQGYRWYDKHGVAPLYPFGYGLSYTNFDFSKLSAAPAGDGGVDVSFRLRNVGPRTGTEVPQVYVGPSPDAPVSVQQAIHKLVQFDRVSLAPGHSADLTLHVAPRQLSYWSSPDQRWVLGTGSRQILVGSSSRDLPLQATAIIH